MTKRVALATLGCKVNQYETQVIRERFKRANFELASFSEEADIYVINTCSVTKRADEKSIDLIRKALQKNNGASVVVTGCLVEADAEKLKDKFPQVKLVGNSEKLKLNELFAPLDSKH
ncbi:tRNA (N(6)-L-threonylcarbamoyladenosine(37)-C(2))-methylthiotransferase MtaB, partial [Patescibacteria group bacterium]|nr:tRNA (N(6)-L-threonylcarbamoyladenosine(37)-C(2))-methylthiotransferase MtaB [Patescibacteria group bacterium]